MLPRLLLALLLLAPCVTHAQEPTLVTPGTIIFGMSATFPPFEYIEDGKPVGFDIDLANLVAKKAGLTAKIVTQDFSGLIPAVLGKRIDAIISGMYINAERSQVVDFVPYLLVGNQIVVRKGNPLAVSGTMSLCGRRVAAPVGTVFEITAKKTIAACAAAGKSELSLLSLTGTTTCALALSQDRVDAIIVSTPTSVALLQSTPDAFDLGGAPFDSDTKVGIGVGKDNPGLRAALSKSMADIVADGSYAKLLAQWKLPPSSSAY